MKGRETVLIAFRSLILLLQPTEGTGKPGISVHIDKACEWSSLKILTPKKSHSACPSGGRRYIRKLTTWNPSNHIFFVSSKKSY